MDVVLEAIQFNHESNAATVDAFNIRRNETAAITLPEWQGNNGSPLSSPAAYAKASIGNNKVIVKARFHSTDTTLGKIWVQALDGHPPPANAANVLGTVPPTEVLLNNGQPDFVPLTLDHVTINTAGVSVSEVIWRWQFSLNGTAWTDLVTTTHRIYTVLSLPTAPWQPLSPQITNIQVPWTEVLDLACDWAKGQQDVAGAAGKITDNINALGPGKVIWDPKSSYIKEGTRNFLCSQFLDLIRRGPQSGQTVNCADCATAVSIFSNILGASLSQAGMGTDFSYNHLIKIGGQAPFASSFQLHEVAWTGDCTNDDFVFDACLQLDGEGPPETDPFVALLPKNMLFGTPEDEQYQFRLSGRKTFGGLCQADPGSKRQRIIGTKQLKRRVTSSMELQALMDLYSFTKWQNTRLPDKHFFVWHSFTSGAEVPGWRTSGIEVFNTDDDMPPTNESLWVPAADADVLLRVNTYECQSLQSAHLFLLTVLGETDVAYMNLEDSRSRTDFGDVAFTNLEGTSMLFARGNMVVSARSANALPTSPAQFLHLFDVSLKAWPTLDEEIESMDRFRFKEGKFYVGEQIPLDFIDGNCLSQTQYKFFAQSGDVFLKGQQLFYQPEAAGPQTILVFGIEAEGVARKQELKIVISSGDVS
jgi:hypothetical protein